MNTALAIIAGTVALAVVIAVLSRRGHRMNLEQWTVGDRSFGVLVMWLLMAGEIYTTFAFLGASGWVYSKGAPVLYVLAYLSLTNIVGFFVSPLIWQLGRRHGLQTQADVFQLLYGGRGLPALVALIGIAAIVPYLQLQLTGLGIIVSVASYGAVSQGTAMAVAGILIIGFVLVSGIRAVAGVSILKDFLMIVTVVAMGVAVPRMLFGGIGPLFARVMETHPSHLVMPGATGAYGHGWYISMVLVCALGPMWPHNLAAIFTAKDGETIKRNMILLPLYNLTIPGVLFVGYAALLTLPGLSNGDLAVMSLVRARFPAWFVGFVGGAGALAAIVPSSIMLLTASTLFAKNMVRPLLAPTLTDVHVARLARVLVVVLTLLCLALALGTSVSLVGLLQLGYGLVGQFFPGIVLGLAWRRTTGRAVGAGIAAGLATLALLEFTRRDPFLGLNAGFVAVVVNCGVMVALCACNVGRRVSVDLDLEDEPA